MAAAAIFNVWEPAESEETYGPQHVPIAEMHVKLAFAYETRGADELAAAHYRAALKIFDSVTGPEYFELAVSRVRMW